jgi:hypothetical protein
LHLRRRPRALVVSERTCSVVRLLALTVLLTVLLTHDTTVIPFLL